MDSPLLFLLLRLFLVVIVPVLKLHVELSGAASLDRVQVAVLLVVCQVFHWQSQPQVRALFERVLVILLFVEEAVQCVVGTREVVWVILGAL